MKKLIEITLGIVTSVGGYLEIGSIATAAESGAGFRYTLLWSLILATLCVIFLVEMAGRFAAISHHTITDGVRERFGFSYFALTLVIMSLLNLLVLAAEIGGMSIALEFATGIGFQWWALPSAILCWGLLWFGTFGFIEKGVAALGLVTLCFVAAVISLRPHPSDIVSQMIPSLTQMTDPHYAFLAVSIIGATISPYLFLFYSSGAVEEKWNTGHLTVNRIVATLGMGFGGMIAVAAMLLAALILAPQGIGDVESYHRLPLLLTQAFGFTGFVLFIVSLLIACLGASLEVGLQQAYFVAQGFGWNWGEDLRPGQDPGFVMIYSVAILLAALVIMAGVDPLKLTMLTMALTAASLPVTVIPFLFLMNDPHYLAEHTNGYFGNAVVLFVSLMACVLAVVAIPLEIFGSGG